MFISVFDKSAASIFKGRADAACFSEMLINIYKTTMCHVSEVNHLHSHYQRTLKPGAFVYFFYMHVLFIFVCPCYWKYYLLSLNKIHIRIINIQELNFDYKLLKHHKLYSLLNTKKLFLNNTNANRHHTACMLMF
jgi:hypothetical protein